MNQHSTIRLVCTGGGSGGHIYPGISVIEHLTSRGMLDRDQVLWISSDAGEDHRVLTAHGIAYESIPAGKLRRYWTREHLRESGRVLSGWTHALRILKAYRPYCVFSKGGFVSVPVVYAAWMLGIPVISHESDLDPGLATKVNQVVSSRICVPFETSRRYYRVHARVVVTGNPLGRIGDDQPVPWDLPEDRPCMLIHGGSLGSASLNTLIWDMLPGIPEDVTVVHVMGTRDERTPPKREGYYPVGYLEGSFSRVMRRSDLIVSRAGAGSLWEQAAAKKAMVLLPLGRGISRGEQERNARYFSEHQAARVHESGTIDTQQVIRDILQLLGDQNLREDIGLRAAGLVHTDGAARIAECICGYLEGEGET